MKRIGLFSALGMSVLVMVLYFQVQNSALFAGRQAGCLGAGGCAYSICGSSWREDTALSTEADFSSTTSNNDASSSSDSPGNS